MKFDTDKPVYYNIGISIPCDLNPEKFITGVNSENEFSDMLEDKPYPNEALHELFQNVFGLPYEHFKVELVENSGKHYLDIFAENLSKAQFRNLEDGVLKNPDNIEDFCYEFLSLCLTYNFGDPGFGKEYRIFTQTAEIKKFK